MPVIIVSGGEVVEMVTSLSNRIGIMHVLPHQGVHGRGRVGGGRRGDGGPCAGGCSNNLHLVHGDVDLNLVRQRELLR